MLSHDPISRHRLTVRDYSENSFKSYSSYIYLGRQSFQSTLITIIAA